MNARRLSAVLAALGGSSLAVACSQSAPATEVPGSASVPATDAGGEHACGNHAEGACGATGASDSVDGSEPPTTHAFDVQPGAFAEANFTMSKGSSVTVTFAKGSAGIAWDVHSHDHSGGTKIHDRGDGGDGTVEFTAPEDGVFSILWKNSGAAPTSLDVSVELGAGARIHSWMPAD